MTALLGHAFCQLAFAQGEEPAPAPSALPTLAQLDSSAQVLGVYRVNDISEHHHTTALFQSRDHDFKTVCKPHVLDGEKYDADSDCGHLVEIVREGEQLALISLPQGSDSIDTFLLYGALTHAKCEPFLHLADAKSLFSSNFCRAVHVKRLDTVKNESYYFYRDMDPLATPDSARMSPQSVAVAHAIVTASLIGLPLGTGSADLIQVPAGETNPSRIVIKDVFDAAILIGTGTITRTMTLERVE
jgi:hypothetical protein